MTVKSSKNINKYIIVFIDNDTEIGKSGKVQCYDCRQIFATLGIQNHWMMVTP